jgi:superfamily II DNA/RNA helicase
MLALAETNRRAPGPKVLALLHWIKEQQCAAVRLGGADPKAPTKTRKWSDRRVLVFTEYGDTKRHLLEILATAVAGTDRGEERILQFHGGMSDEGREEVQRAFNSPPDQHPVRILLCTDAAREGVNPQGHCADLFHFDVPWNPARMEQRNGRIDRTLQPEPEVRCHYFFYPQRAEDAVLRKLVTKVDLIQKELGSLSAVVLDRLGAAMEDGIDAGTEARLSAAEQIDLFEQEGTSGIELLRAGGPAGPAPRDGRWSSVRRDPGCPGRARGRKHRPPAACGCRGTTLAGAGEAW